MVSLEAVQGTSFPETLLEKWELLLQRSGVKNPYLTPLWAQVWVKHFGGSLRPQILMFHSDSGEMTGLGAFLETADSGGKGLALLGSEDVWDYRDFVVAPEAEGEVFAHFIRYFSEAPWDFIEFSGISEFSPTYQRLVPQFRAVAFQVTEEKLEPCIYLPLPPSWDAFLASLNSKDRHELRRKLRRVERDSSFQIEEARHSADLQNMERFFALHTVSKNEKAEFMTAEMKAYFRDLALHLEEKNWLELAFLKVENRDAAAVLSFRFAETEYLYNSGYDPQFARFSPGIILVAERIGRAIRNGLKTFNFLKGRENYKFRLGGREEQIYRIRVEKKER